MLKIMRSSSINGMTSQTECFPMVLLEAMSCGLPIVTFDCPNGPRNIITPDEDGFLVQDQDVPGLSEKLRLLMSDNSVRDNLGVNGRMNVKRFHVSEIMPKWFDLFNSLKNNNEE